jgi:subfamily B ATP-binding cassette protein MsbA
MNAFLKLLKRYPWSLPILVALGVAASLSEGIGVGLIIPFIESLHSNQAAPGALRFLSGPFSRIPAETRIWLIPLCILASIVLRNALLYLNTLIFSRLNWSICHQLRCEVFDQLLSVSYGFLEQKKAGNLLHTLNGQTWQATQALSSLAGMVVNACTILVFVSLMLMISWPLTLLTAGISVLISITAYAATRNTIAAGKAASQANAAFVAQSLEVLNAMKAVRAFVREDFERTRFEESSGHACRAFRKLERVTGFVGPFSEVLSTGLLIGIVLFGVRSAAVLPAMIAFIFMLYRLQPKLRQFDMGRAGLAACLADIEELLALLDRSDKPYIHSGSQICFGLRESIELRGVTFRYRPGDAPALTNVSIRIPKGKTTAIVGPSGAGKSTLIDLLFRFNDPLEGEIRVDGTPLKHLDLKSWRRRIAFLSQEAFIFNASVRENIAYGRADATDEEIAAAAKKANAHEFIEQLPQGYQTSLGERGVRLSGGQRQRIALARAIVRNAEILILDEATNALDTISERLVQEALASYGRDRTTIVIAHRLSTIEHADQVLVLDNGRVVEQGVLREVLQAGGLFARLYRA